MTRIQIFHCKSAEFFFSCCGRVAALWKTTFEPRSSTCGKQLAATRASD
jgi:hypothetical protein